VQVYAEGGKSGPEEIVRQLWAYKLMQQYGYKADEIDLEKSVQLLVNESRRTAEDNPLARIMGWERAIRDELTLTTTTEHLAQRLGHAVEKAFGGEVRYDFSHENKVARVDWRRD
jgi:hypothetical protein